MFRFAFVTDIHFDESFGFDETVNQRKNWKTVLVDLQKRGIKNLVFGCDLGKPSGYAEFFEDVKNFDLNLIIGNHDEPEEIKNYFRPQHENNYYTFETEDYKLIFMDSGLGKVDQEQLKWLANEILTEKVILLFIHYPVLNVGTAMDKFWKLENRDEIAEILENATSQIFSFSGHYHMEDMRSEGNITQVLTPAVSYQILKNQTEEIVKSDRIFGYRIVEIMNGKLDSQVIVFNNPLV